MTIRTWAEITGGIIVLALCGMVWAYASLTDSLSTQLEETTEELGGVRRTNVELVRDAQATSLRETTSRSAREGIIAAPEGDNGAAAPVLLQGLRGADAIGGLE